MDVVRVGFVNVALRVPRASALAACVMRARVAGVVGSGGMAWNGSEMQMSFCNTSGKYLEGRIDIFILI